MISRRSIFFFWSFPRLRGFTMVEMLVVVFLLGVVIALAIPSVYSSRIRAKGAAESQNLRLIEAAKKEFVMDNPGKDLEDVTRLLRYLPGNRLPKSPWGGDYATYSGILDLDRVIVSPFNNNPAYEPPGGDLLVNGYNDLAQAGVVVVDRVAAPDQSGLQLVSVPVVEPSPMVAVDGMIWVGGLVEPFYLAQKETTIQEWNEVADWAVENGYPQLEVLGGDLGLPVHSRYPPFIFQWLNAKSEMEGLQPAYFLNGEVYRSAPWSFDLMSRIVFNPQANGYRLPVTLEWKLAASGGVYSSGFTYSGSNSVEDVAWAYGSAPWYRGPQSVGLKQPNELGFYDMHGNVSEFVWDSSDPQDGLSQSLKHIGGSFASDPFYFNWTDPIARNWNAGQWAWGGSMPGYDFIGFRVARSVGELSSQ